MSVAEGRVSQQNGASSEAAIDLINQDEDHASQGLTGKPAVSDAPAIPVSFAPSIRRELTKPMQMVLAPPPEGYVYDVYRKPGGIGMFIGCKREDDAQVVAEIAQTRELAGRGLAMHEHPQQEARSVARASSIQKPVGPPRKKTCSEPQVQRLFSPRGLVRTRDSPGLRSEAGNLEQAAKSTIKPRGASSQSRRLTPPSPLSAARSKKSKPAERSGGLKAGNSHDQEPTTSAPRSFPPAHQKKAVVQPPVDKRDHNCIPRLKTLEKHPPKQTQTFDNGGNDDDEIDPFGGGGVSLRDRLRARVMEMDIHPMRVRNTTPGSKPNQKRIPHRDHRRMRFAAASAPAKPNSPYGQRKDTFDGPAGAKPSWQNRLANLGLATTPPTSTQTVGVAKAPRSSRSVKSVGSVRSLRTLGQETDYNEMDSLDSGFDSGITGMRKRKRSRSQSGHRERQAAGGTPNDKKEFHRIMLEQVKEWSRSYIKDGILPTYIRFKEMHGEAVESFKQKLKVNFPQCYEDELVDYIMGNKFGGERRNEFRRSGSSEYRKRLAYPPT
ncbi:hypothetical protein BSKO_08965 [Bryopsis sp. KO-2023]|nr:hypothetical protein BSKO_08965 [Bryopsis sp. KO-2023]